MSVLAEAMIFWNKSCIDTTTDAVEILRLYNKPVKNPEGIIDFAKSLYRKDEGFRLSDGTYGFLYTNRYAFELDKIARKDWGMEPISPEMKEEMRGFIKKCGVKENGKIGYRFHPKLEGYLRKRKANPEIYSTYYAVKILTDNNWLDKEKIPEIINFIDSLFEEFRTEKNNKAGGFKNIQNQIPKIATTSYALDAVRKLYK